MPTAGMFCCICQDAADTTRDGDENPWPMDADGAINPRGRPVFMPVAATGDEGTANAIKIVDAPANGRMPKLDVPRSHGAEAECMHSDTLPSTIERDEDIHSECELTMKDKTWLITLRRQQLDQVVGVVLDKASDALCVRQHPDKGLALDWNRRNPSLALRPADILEAVNGATGTGPQVVKELRNSRQLRIKVKRLLMFPTRVYVGVGEKLAVDFTMNSRGQLEVSRVREGAVMQHNKCCKAGNEILGGDIVVACEGFEAPTPEALRDHLTNVLGNPVLWIKRTG